MKRIRQDTYRPPVALVKCLQEAERRLRIGGGIPKPLRERIIMLLAVWSGREQKHTEESLEQHG